MKLINLMILFVLIVPFSMAGYQNKFTNGQIEENLSFSQNQSSSRYIELPLYINVTDASLDITYTEITSSCFVEYAQTPIPSCYKGGGEYIQIQGYTNWYDGDYTTYSGSNPGGFSTWLIANYTKNTKVTNYTHIIKVMNLTVNNTLNLEVPMSCVDYYPERLVFRDLSGSAPVNDTVSSSCYNGAWETLYYQKTDKYWFEEAISYTLHNSVNISDVEIYKYSYLNNTRLNFSTEINNIINNSCTCTGCINTSEVCKIPILFYSDSYGNFLIENITINYSYLINISIYDQTTGELINTDVGISLSNDDEQINLNTTTGVYYGGIPSINYTLALTSDNYTRSVYAESTFKNSFYAFDGYLLPETTNSVIFTIKSEDSQAIIEGAFVEIYRLIGTTWVLISSLVSDVTGRVTFYYETDNNYKFIITRTGYLTKTFELNPINYNSYNVWLEAINLVSYDFDYSGLYVSWDPKTVSDNQTTTFTVSLISPIGELNSYNMEVSYNSASNSSAGSFASGETMTVDLNIFGAEIGDKVKLTYSYQKTDGELKEFTHYIDIYNITGDGNTWGKNKDNHYGLGLFERVLILTFIVIIVAGLIGYFTNEGAGSIMALMIYAFFWKMEFVNPWVISISVIILLIIALWRSRQ